MEVPIQAVDQDRLRAVDLDGLAGVPDELARGQLCRLDLAHLEQSGVQVRP